MRKIPRGRVMTYGQIAALTGHPRRARAVGFVAHYGDPSIPWQRVVNRHGRVAPGYPGGMAVHRAELSSEGVEVDDDFTCDLGRYQWWPDETP
ncbi:MAG: MGMT family protein [bacterium]|nr:MGMT family protein [bacterium]